MHGIRSNTETALSEGPACFHIVACVGVVHILRILSYKCPPIEARSPHSECQLPSNNVYQVHSNFSDFASSAKIAKIDRYLPSPGIIKR